MAGHQVKAHHTEHSGVGVRLTPRGAAKITIVVPAEVGEVEFGCSSSATTRAA